MATDTPPPTGVLLMAYGTPASPDDIESYYTHVRRGRPPTPELLAELRSRYDAIGGTSPLLERTRAQAAGLQAALGGGYHVELGMKHAPPFIEDGIAHLRDLGIDQAVGVVLAPHYSVLSIGEYAGRARATPEVEGGALEMTFVESWHLEPGYLQLLADRVRDAVTSLGPCGRVEVVFTAHSLPARLLGTGDPYADQLAATAQAVAALLGLAAHHVAWQSAGRTPEPWIGPDLLSVLPQLAADGAGGVVVCPAGFVSDHLEVLYDLDVEATTAAANLGIAFARTASLNDDPIFCTTLSGVVAAHAAHLRQ
ncbi:MAG TPA: ferrochelatase [Acidimicrobiales bacterium]|nr:ferrochelatase [Acidimicrobiales bacterium]